MSLSEQDLLLDAELGATVKEKFKSKSGLDFSRFLRVIIRNSYWIVLLGIIGLGIAHLWLKYQVPLYQVVTTVGFGDNQRTSEANQILEMAGLTLEQNNLKLNNEILILQSYDLLDKVVDSLDLDFQMVSVGRVRTLPLHYSAFPARMKLGRSSSEQTRGEFEVSYNSSGVVFSHKKNEKKTIVTYGKPTVLPTGDTMLISTAPNPAYFEKKYSLTITPRDVSVKNFSAQLFITPVSQSRGFIRMTMTSSVPETALEFLKVLIHFYRQASLEFKNEAIVQAKSFLDGRIDSVGRDLNAAETRITNFQIENKVLEPNSVAGYDLGQLTGLDQQRNQSYLQTELVNELEKSLRRADYGNDIVANPFGVQDPIIGGLISQYNSLVLSKRRIRETGTPDDPTLPLVNAQIDELRSTLLRNFANIRTQARILEANNRKLDQEFTSRFRDMPPKQQELTNLRRQMSMKERLYEYLLQKREDFAVQLASGSPEARMISEPRSTGQVSPNQTLAYGIGGGLGLGLPLILIALAVLLNKRLETRKEVELLSDLPIVGEINNDQEHQNIPIQVLPGNRDLLAEQYRALRSNLMFMGLEERSNAIGKAGKVILITSFMRDEGKSFTTLNLASILAQTGKRTIILEFDLRKPKISSKLRKKQNTGISQYLVNPAIQLDDIIVPAYEAIPNLFLMPTGPLAPNPAELLHHQRIEEMFIHLKASFDYIVVDSAPVGLVSDTLSLAPLSDITLYILRHKYSVKSTISEADRLQFEGKMKNVGLVINGIRSSGFVQKYYNYYGGKYQYGYE